MNEPNGHAVEAAVVNHDEAREYAQMHPESNLARCYLALARPLEVAAPVTDAETERAFNTIVSLGTMTGNIRQALNDFAASRVPVASVAVKSDEDVIALARMASSENHYSGGRCVRMEFTPSNILSFVRALATPAPGGAGGDVSADLIACLRGGRQCDETGEEIIMSRQACCEAADILERIATQPPKQDAAPVAVVAWDVDGGLTLREDWADRLHHSRHRDGAVATGRAIPQSWTPVLFATPAVVQPTPVVDK